MCLFNNIDGKVMSRNYDHYNKSIIYYYFDMFIVRNNVSAAELLSLWSNLNRFILSGLFQTEALLFD